MTIELTRKQVKTLFAIITSEQIRLRSFVIADDIGEKYKNNMIDELVEIKDYLISVLKNEGDNNK